jgi:hypothetical protein
MNFRRDSKWSLTVITAIKVARMVNYKNAEVQRRNICRKNENCVLVKNAEGKRQFYAKMSKMSFC